MAVKRTKKLPTGYKFFGTYTVAQDCSGQTNTYEITVATSAVSEDAVVFNNFYNLGINGLNATVNGDNITIPSQVINAITFTGNGSISGNILTLNYTLANGAASVACTAICTKK